MKFGHPGQPSVGLRLEVNPIPSDHCSYGDRTPPCARAACARSTGPARWRFTPCAASISCWRRASWWCCWSVRQWQVTLLNILGGLDTATSGEAWFLDHELSSLDDAGLTRYRREHVGFVFQFYNLIPSLTALENVALVTEIARNPMEPSEALTLVGLGERLHHFPAQLSGGEQQRVAIARAIAKRPDLLLCDERPAHSTARPAYWCSRRSNASTRNWARPPC